MYSRVGGEDDRWNVYLQEIALTSILKRNC